jgi:Domain of unknown function (DUF4926)
MVAFKEHDAVVLDVDLPANGLKKGTIGTIVHIFTEPRLAYEVEFCDGEGRIVAQLPLPPEQVVPRKPNRLV